MRPVAALVLALALASPLALAGPPIEDAPTTEVDAVPVADEAAGFWLSVELIGPRGAQLDAARSLAQPPVVDALPRGGAPPPGELVGRVETLAQALAWVDANSFGSLDEPAGEDATAIPGGRLLAEHGVILTALVVTGQALAGTQPYPWPQANALPLPAGVDWRPASLAIARTPVFAAPAPSLPPAAERYMVAQIDDAIWLLDTRDSCESGACLRWARILVRHGDRFFGGWIPATHVVPDDAWIPGPGERRFALQRGHRTRAEVGYVLIEQRGELREPPLGLRREHVGDDWPEAAVNVLGEQLIVTIGGETMLSRHIETTPLLPP